jgi:ribonucleotide monophosphatase NagD (HAD superfamily)
MLELSQLNKTWIIDIDGTILKHNGHLDGKEEILEGVKEFFEMIDKCDKVIFISSRQEQYKERLEKFLKESDIKYDTIICGVPFGERILINDKKSSGLKTAFAINKIRDAKFEVEYKINENL